MVDVLDELMVVSLAYLLAILLVTLLDELMVVNLAYLLAILLVTLLDELMGFRMVPRLVSMKPKLALR